MAPRVRLPVIARRFLTLPASSRTLFPSSTAVPPLQRMRLLSTESKHPGRNQYQDGRHPFAAFDLGGKVFAVTGGGRGLGLTMAEGLVEAGGRVHCLDQHAKPDNEFIEVRGRLAQRGDSLEYHNVDVTDNDALETIMEQVASERSRMDGLIAAAGIQQVTPALEYRASDVQRMLSVNFTGVLLSARACARQILRTKTPNASIILIASMSGLIANRGFLAPVYNSSKAAVIQLARNLAMEWGPIKEDGSGGIRVNCISPGHILTPMVLENIRRGEAHREEWEQNNMLGRLSEREEYKGAGVFLASRASSYMTGSNLVIDGGTTAW